MSELSQADLADLVAVHKMPEGLKKELEVDRLAKKLSENHGMKISKKTVRQELKQLAAQAGSVSEDPVDPDALLRDAWSVLNLPDQLAVFRRKLHEMGYAGATEPVELLWLALHSRSLDRPINVVVRGPSAVGKSHAVIQAMAFHPPEAIHDLTATSERALAYTRFDTRHTYIMIAEASALYREGPGATIIRSIAWGGGIRYETVQKTPQGLEAVIIDKPGPTGLITTSVRDLEEEISTRVLQVHIDESPEQTRKIVQEHARADAGQTGRETDAAAWIAASRWLATAGRHDVVVPFSPQIADAVPVDDVRVRRDYDQLIAVIKVHALVHQWGRSREEDGRIIPPDAPTGTTAVTIDVDPPRGRIVAEEADYRAAYRLLGKVLAVTLDDVSDVTRETVRRVEELLPQHAGGVSYQVLGDGLRITRQAATKRARTALKAGFLVNKEDRRGYPARLDLGDPVPAPRPILPEPDALFGGERGTMPPENEVAWLPPQRNPLADNDLNPQPDPRTPTTWPPQSQPRVADGVARLNHLQDNSLDAARNLTTRKSGGKALPLSLSRGSGDDLWDEGGRDTVGEEASR
ncbi:hypothetical protein BH18GEM1_BH18GEM1_08240 [soil metagenome]